MSPAAGSPVSPDSVHPLSCDSAGLGVGTGASARVAPRPYSLPQRKGGVSPSDTSQRSDAGRGPHGCNPCADQHGLSHPQNASGNMAFSFSGYGIRGRHFCGSQCVARAAV